MEESPRRDRGRDAFDSARPFRGVVVCCTSIGVHERSQIAKAAEELGGLHQYDLTPEVTHLIVGDYDTDKYRHVARERPDIKPMAAGWVDAVKEPFLKAEDIDFEGLENEWTLKTFEASGGLPMSSVPASRERRRLLCCLTGFLGAEERSWIEETVKENGGEYTADLSRRVTHLIVNQPEGKKYRAAKEWGVTTVSIEWLSDSVSRGMILEEKLYDPILPKEERGQGAWTRKEVKRDSLGKRARDTSSAVQDGGQRKLRKTASMKFHRQGSNVWSDILPQQPASDMTRQGLDSRALATSAIPMVAESRVFDTSDRQPASHRPDADANPPDGGIFAGCRFFFTAFDERKSQLLHEHLTSNGGQVSPSLEDAASSEHPENADQRFLIVSQTSQPDEHPSLPPGVHIVTEFYIERCLHSRRMFHPNDHVLGRPFPQFPIPGFGDLIICTAGFKNEQLNQVEKAVVQLGAKYSERLNAQSSVLVCPATKEVRRQKLDFALLSKVPVVNADWLWQCISSAYLVPWDEFLFPDLKQRLSIDIDPALEKERQKMKSTKSESALKGQRAGFRAPVSKTGGIDKSAFEDVEPLATIPNDLAPNEPTTASEYETAQTHQVEGHQLGGSRSAPLSEVSTNVLNKSPSPQKGDQTQREPFRRFPTGGTVGDSEGGDDSDATATHESKGRPEKESQEEARKRSAEQQAMADRLKSWTGADRASTTGSTGNRGEAVGSGGGEAVPQHKRRKREILGRAVSNASADSSASNGEVLSGRINPVVMKPLSASAGLSQFDIPTPGPVAAVEDENPPPATQIGYANPEAKKRRAEVEAHFRGGGGKRATPRKSGGDKVVNTIGGLKGDVAGSVAGGFGTAASRRSKRR